MSELAAAGLTTLPCQAVALPRIAQAPVAFECTLWELPATASRRIFVGRVRRLHARDGLIDTQAWRVRLQDCFPAARFGASVCVTTRERFSFEAGTGAIDEP